MALATNSKASEIDGRPFSKRSKLRTVQIQLFILLARELAASWQRNRTLLSGLLEYGRFMSGAHACGFVCGDFSPAGPFAQGESYDRLMTSPREVSTWPIQKVRHLVAFIARAERSNLETIDDETGWVRRALDSGLISVIADRLEQAFNQQPA